MRAASNRRNLSGRVAATGPRDVCAFLGNKRLRQYCFRRFGSGINSAVRKRLLRLPGQSEIAQSTPKWSSQVHRDGVMASAVHLRSGGGIGLWNKRSARPRTKAKMLFVKRADPARSITLFHRAVFSTCFSEQWAISRIHERRTQERSECRKA